MLVGNTIGNYKKTPPFLGFLRKSSRDSSQKSPLSRENVNAHAAPSCIRVGGGGGGAYLQNFQPVLIVIPTSYTF